MNYHSSTSLLFVRKTAEVTFCREANLDCLLLVPGRTPLIVRSYFNLTFYLKNRIPDCIYENIKVLFDSEFIERQCNATCLFASVTFDLSQNHQSKMQIKKEDPESELFFTPRVAICYKCWINASNFKLKTILKRVFCKVWSCCYTD